MTETEVRALIDKVMEEKAKKKASNWAESSFEDATKAGILDGTMPQAPLTREQFAVVLHNLHFVEMILPRPTGLRMHFRLRQMQAFWMAVTHMGMSPVRCWRRCCRTVT